MQNADNLVKKVLKFQEYGFFELIFQNTTIFLLQNDSNFKN